MELGDGNLDKNAVNEGDLQATQRTVDGESYLSESVQLFYDGNDEYSVLLTQTNVDENKNKYYILQLHENNRKEEWYVWHHWGRVGYKGRHMTKECGSDKNQAIKMFSKKFKEKTGNEWQERARFQKKPGKYDLMKRRRLEFSQIEGEHMKIAMRNSNLPIEVKELLKLMFSTEIMEKTIETMGFNLKEAPLGTMNHQQIMKGHAALKKIEQCILDEEPEEYLWSACNEYYTKISHNFRMKKPLLINTTEKIQSELNILESLENIYIALMILKKPSGDDNPIDIEYRELKCSLKPLQKTDEDFDMVHRYLKDTHAPTHENYTMEILDLFEVTKEELPFEDVGNRQLLWHGSRLTNWAGILKKGLRIAPPEAPSAGYMFGKGVYFADRSSKSCNYCKANEDPHIGLALLCEVALGESNELIAGDKSADQLPSGKHSVKALGQIEPDPNQNKYLPCGTLVPWGEGILTDEPKRNDRKLKYNEYIVYDTKQIKMRYLVKIKFNWK